MKKKKHISSYKGFTLLEVLVATVIVIMLTMVAVTSYGSVTKKSRDARRSSDIEQIRQALEMYRSTNGFYPPVNTTGFGNVTALAASLTSYMARIPVDPKAHPYQYRATNVSGGNYYGYCLVGAFETGSSSNECNTLTPPLSLPTIGGTAYTYGVRQP